MKSTQQSNSFHLTPKVFTHFWAWWSLFNSTLSLPIRQGFLFPQRKLISKKFGRHIATLKYRLSLADVYVSHIYIDDSVESWSKGETSSVGLKARIDRVQADMHQRVQETVILTGTPPSAKKIHHRPIYSAEVNLIELHIQAIKGLFEDPLKRLTATRNFPQDIAEFAGANGPIPIECTSPWFNLNDFVEIDWLPLTSPTQFFVTPVATCPYFIYRKCYNKNSLALETSRFGVEDTHRCLMGKGISEFLMQFWIFHFHQAFPIKKRTRLKRF